MYKRILLAYDGSREGRRALREGALWAKRSGAEVFVLAITAPMASVDPMGAPLPPTGEHEEILREGLAKAAEFGLKAKGEVVTGQPVDIIRRYANGWKADLVVVGHRKRQLLERWWSGPSHSVLSDHLNCSLLISLNQIDDAAAMRELATMEGEAARMGG